MRCPDCGARNAATAEWCTQCYAVLATPPSTGTPAAPAPGTAPTTDAPAPTTPARGHDDAGGVLAGDVPFRRTDEGLDWRCGVCGGWNPLERSTCATCQAPFGRALAPEPDAPPPDVSELAVVAASLVLPGAGHLMLRRTGAGVLRILLYVVWLAGGLALLRAASAAGQPALPAVPLLLGAVAVLGASVVEAQQATEDRPLTLLTARVVLWLVVGVLGLLMLSFITATLGATA